MPNPTFMEFVQIIPERIHDLSVGSFIRSGWEIFKKRPWFLIGVNLAFISASIFLSALDAFVVTPILKSLFFGILADLISSVISFGIGLLISLFLFSFLLKAYNSIDTVKFADAFDVTNYWKFVGTYLLFILICGTGFILLIVPGIIFALKYGFSILISIDKGFGPIESLKESARITQDQKVRLFSFWSATILVCILGIVALFVGILAAGMVANLAYICAYRSMAHNADASMLPTKLSVSEKLLTVLGILANLLLIGTLVLILLFARTPNPKAVYVLMDPQQPAQSVLPLNVARVPFTVFTITNNTDKEIAILGIEVEHSDLNDDAGISGIQLIDSNGRQIGSTVTPDSNRKATIESNFKLQPMSSTTLTLAANIAGCDHACVNEGQNVSISILGVRSSGIVLGVWPLAGAEHIMNSQLKLGSVTATQLGKTETYKDLPHDKDIKFISTQFTAGFQEDVRFYSIRYKYVGSLDIRNLSNIQATIAGKNYPAMIDLENRTDAYSYFTVIVQDGVPIIEGETLTVTLHGNADTNGEQQKTVEFDVENSSDVYFIGEVYGYGINPVSKIENTGTWMRGTALLVR